MANTCTLISTYSVGAGGITTISFTSIPQTYTDLKLVYSLKPASGGDIGVRLNFNSSTSGYSDIYLQALNTTSSPQPPSKGTNVYAGAAGYAGAMNDSTLSGGNLATNSELYIPNYTVAQGKAFLVSASAEANRNLGFIEEVSSYWNNTAAITRIDFVCNSAQIFGQYSVASLYGIKNV
jgi:hypothetical protein